MADSGETQQALSDATGISQSTLSNYLRAARLPGAAELMALARHYGITTDSLLGVADALASDGDFRLTGRQHPASPRRTTITAATKAKLRSIAEQMRAGASELDKLIK